MAGLRIEGHTSGNVAEVNTSNELKVALTSNRSIAGYATILSEIDSGSVTGSSLKRAPEVSSDFKTRTGLDTFLFDERFPGTALNTNSWYSAISGMTIAISGGFLVLNSNASTIANHVARVGTWRGFPVFRTSQTYLECMVQFTQTPISNNICEWGFGIASGVAAPTDGAFFRINSSGEFRAIINANGVEIQSDPLNFDTLIGINTTKNCIISLGSDNARFWIDDVLVATIVLPTGGYSATSSNNLPILFRNHNTSATSAVQSMKIGGVNVSLGDWHTSKNYAHQMSGAGFHSSIVQTGSTPGQTAQWANSANPSAAAPTNTTAALGSGLGGIFIANVNGLAVTTDYIISSYKVPTGTSTLFGKTLYITGVKVSAGVAGAANGAGGPTTWALALAYGHTTVSLATAESGTAKAPRRIPLGLQSVATSAAIGTIANECSTSFNTPIVVNQGEFVQVIMRLLVNNSSASQTSNFYISFEGYFE